MDEDLRGLERRWLESGDEADRFAWLCQKLRQGPDEELAGDMRELEEAVRVTFDDPDVSTRCEVGFDTSDPEPLGRVSSLSGHKGWFPAADLEEALKTVLNVRSSASLYPHSAFNTTRVATRFEHLFGNGVVFVNYKEDAEPNVWSRVVSRLEGPLEDWEHAGNLAIGATLGPLVGYISINARDSL